MPSTGPVTEVAELPLKPGLDANSPVIHDTIAVPLAQPGAQRAYFGMQLESPNVLSLLIDWDSHGAHIAFTKDPSYGPFMEKTGALLSGSASLTHAYLRPFPAIKALSATAAPTTELFYSYYETSISEDERAEVEKRVDQLLAVLEEQATVTGSARGWLVEQLVPPGMTEPAAVMLAVVGWHSKEAHLACRETEAFKKAIVPVREAPKLVKLRAFHVQNQDMSAGASTAMRAEGSSAE